MPRNSNDTGMDYEFKCYGEKAAADAVMCHNVMRVLQQAYPGHEWMVNVDHDRGVGVVTIQLPFAPTKSNKNWGMVLHITTVESPSGSDEVRRSGGELLERFGLPRSGATRDSAMRAVIEGLDCSNYVKKTKGKWI